MFQIDCLSAINYLPGLSRVHGNPCEFPHKIISITEIEQYQRVLVEVILNTGSTWCHDWLAQCQIFKDPSGRIDLRKNTALIGDHFHVAFCNRLAELFQSSGSEIMHSFVKAFLLHVQHNLIQEWRPRTVNP